MAKAKTTTSSAAGGGGQEADDGYPALRALLAGKLAGIERRSWLLQRNCGPTTADEIDRFFGRAA